MTDKLSAAMQIAERIHSLAQEQNDAALIIAAYGAFAVTFYSLCDFETARQYARRGVQLWRSGNVQFHPEQYFAPVVNCLIYAAMCDWHFRRDRLLPRADGGRDLNSKGAEG